MLERKRLRKMGGTERSLFTIEPSWPSYCSGRGTVLLMGQRDHIALVYIGEILDLPFFGVEAR